MEGNREGRMERERVLLLIMLVKHSYIHGRRICQHMIMIGDICPHLFIYLFIFIYLSINVSVYPHVYLIATSHSAFVREIRLKPHYHPRI